MFNIWLDCHESMQEGTHTHRLVSNRTACAAEFSHLWTSQDLEVGCGFLGRGGNPTLQIYSRVTLLVLYDQKRKGGGAVLINVFDRDWQN